MGGLQAARARRDNTPVKIAASSAPRPAAVVSRFFDEEGDAAAREALEEATRRSLFESLGPEEDDEDEDQPKLPAPVAVAAAAEAEDESEPAPTPVGRLTLRPTRSKSAVLAGLLAPSQLSSQALKRLSRRHSNNTKTEAEDDDDENEEEVEEDRPAAKKLDLGKFAFNKRS